MRISTLISRLFFVLGIGLSVVILADFFKFAEGAINSPPNTKIEKADGIAALTGGSRQRLTRAIDLLENGKAKRLLISGVYKKATRDELRAVAGGSANLYDCCIDIGKEATDTIGNGREIANWAAKNKYKKIIIVTDNYHMPRSLLEIKNQAPNLELIAYSVNADPYINKEWWKNSRAVRGISLEYYKYLGARTRIKFGFNPEKARQ